MYSKFLVLSLLSVVVFFGMASFASAVTTGSYQYQLNFSTGCGNIGVTPTGSGWSVYDQVCVLNGTSTSDCTVNAVLWRRASTQNYTYVVNNCEPVPGYTQTTHLQDNAVPIRNICLWEAPSSTPLDMKLGHAGTGNIALGGQADCRTSVDGPYMSSTLGHMGIYTNFMSRTLVYNTAPNMSDICLFSAAPTSNNTCTTNSDCGTNGLIGSPFCKNGNVYQTYRTWTCGNNALNNNQFFPPNSQRCSFTDVDQLQQTCSGSCSNGTCGNGGNIACNLNSDCGTNGLTGSPTCSGNSIYQNYRTWTCNNPGTTSSTCTPNVTSQYQSMCAQNQTCTNGTCTNVASLTATCTASPSSALVNQPVTFTANVAGGTGTYSYSWAGFCNGFGQSCVNSFSSPNTYNVFLNVTSGTQTISTSCTTTVAQTNTGSCNSNADCQGSGYIGTPFCSGNNVYQNYSTYTCLNPGTSNSVCSPVVAQQLRNSCTGNQTCSNGSCTGNTNTCTSHSYQQCLNNGVYWFDSCGNQQELSQACNGNQVCSGSACINNNNNNNCTYHAYKNCSGNSVFWFNSCGLQQDVYQICSGNQTCSNGNCVGNNNNGTCTYHAYESCLNNGVYWFDSCGNQQDLVQNCNGGQTCSGNTCVGQTQNQGNLTVITTVRNLSSGNLNWSSSVTASPGDILQFNVALTNSSNQSVNNVTVRDILPANLIYRNNLTVDGVVTAGDITQGVNIGSVLGGQTRNVDYQVQVAPAQNFPFGTTTLTDSVNTTSASGYNPANSSASVQVVRQGVLGATSVSTGLTNNPLLDSFFIPLMIALVGVWLVRSGIVGLPQWVIALQTKGQASVTQKQLQSKISQIRQNELAS